MSSRMNVDHLTACTVPDDGIELLYDADTTSLYFLASCMSPVFDCNLMDVAGKLAIGFRCHDDRMHNLIRYYYDGRCKKTSFIISNYQYLYTYSSLVFEFPILLITPILDMYIVFNILLTI